jgi:hypothetical protein
VRTIRWTCLGVLCLSLGLVAQEEYTKVFMYDLANFYYREPRQPVAVENRRAGLNDSVPAKIRALDGKKIFTSGFIVPYDQSLLRMTEFMLVVDEDDCAFADGALGMNRWIDVRMKPGTVAKWTGGGEVAVRGTFSVGDEFDRDGYVLSLYRLTADSVK